MKKIDIIKAKLTELKNLDKRFAIFGARSHQYKLNKTLSEEGINQIEEYHQIVLSDEYKAILQHFGNGRAGCGYGLEKMNLGKINPPYIGTKKLLRNWKDPEQIDEDMFDRRELSGYIKLFDFGCGIEYCLIVKGEEIGNMIWFDCNDCFSNMGNVSITELLDEWLDESLEVMKRVKKKLDEMSLQEVVDSEWKLQNYSVKDMILSIMDVESIQGTFNDQKAHLEKEYLKWKKQKDNFPKQ